MSFSVWPRFLKAESEDFTVWPRFLIDSSIVPEVVVDAPPGWLGQATIHGLGSVQVVTGGAAILSVTNEADVSAGASAAVSGASAVGTEAGGQAVIGGGSKVGTSGGSKVSI